MMTVKILFLNLQVQRVPGR